MNNSKKKTAPRAATPETEKKIKNIPTSSILLTCEKIKCIMQKPNEISRAVNIFDLPPELLRAKVRFEPITDDLWLVSQPKSTDALTVAVSGQAYRGAVAIVAIEYGEARDMSVREIQTARAWLLRHTV